MNKDIFENELQIAKFTAKKAGEILIEKRKEYDKIKKKKKK